MADPVLKDDLQPRITLGSTVLASHRIPLPATFRFTCYGTSFDAGISGDGQGGAHLVVRGNLGHLPYSAESVTARSYLHTVIDAGMALPNAKIDVDRKQAIVVRGQMNFPAVPSPAIVAAGAAAITIAVKPVCELVAKCRRASGL